MIVITWTAFLNSFLDRAQLSRIFFFDMAPLIMVANVGRTITVVVMHFRMCGYRIPNVVISIPVVPIPNHIVPRSIVEGGIRRLMGQWGLN